MPLFRRHEQDDDERRFRVGLLVAVAAHVERNTPVVFPKATTDLLEAAADELLTGNTGHHGELSFETRTVVRRILESVDARGPDRPWADALRDALGDLPDD